MLKDLTRDDWLGMLNIPESRIPKAVILRGTRNLKSYYDDYRKHFSNILEVGTPNGVVEDIFIGDLDGLPVAYASVYGAPMASEVVHLFGVIGTRLVVQTGCCGMLADGLGPGDLFVVQSAYRGEGASQYYHPENDTVEATIDIDATVTAHCGDLVWRRGSIYTTSALFAEGLDDVERWHRDGHGAVDMETAATFAVAQYFGMDRASVLFGFDNPRHDTSLFSTETEQQERRGEGNRRMIEIALQVVKTYSRSDR